MPSTTLTPDPPPLAGVPGTPTLRLATVPDSAPPYDCDTHDGACPAAPAGLGAAVPRLGTAERQPHPAACTASPAAAGAATAWPRQFAQVVVEILAGRRPLRQILPWTTDRARAQIRRLAPLLADRRLVIRRIMVSRPAAHAVEMTVIVSCGPRTRALAMRFEHVPERQAAPGLPARPARWLCTEIEAG
ncbi:MAG: hypothetical protein JO132_20755 [Streptosporangiaceae bacterium]|nr:hypothetical protein [Streptosporangiaceae bacterium]